MLLIKNMSISIAIYANKEFCMKNKFKFFGLVVVLATVGLIVSACDDLLSTEDVSNNTSAYYSWYGNGSATNYTISTAAQLRGLSDIVMGRFGDGIPPQDDFRGKTITLIADIDLSNQIWRSIGYSYEPVDPFNGTFDGNNRIIFGFITSNGQGFFGLIGEYGIVENINFDSFTASGDDGVGGLARINDGTIQNIRITNGSVSGTSPGGIVYSNWGIIQNTNFSGTVTAELGDAGGIAGKNNSGGIIRDCNVIGIVTNYRSGSYDGIVGFNNGSVINCHYN